MLLATLERYLEIFTTVAVVVRSQDGILATHLLDQLARNPPLIIPTNQAHLGLGHSIADGIRATATWDSVFIGLADMPFVQRGSLHTLYYRMLKSRQAHQKRIIQPRFQGQPGHPVGFSCEFFPELMALTGDQGARSVLRKHSECLEVVDLDDPGIVQDLDVPGGN